MTRKQQQQTQQQSSKPLGRSIHAARIYPGVEGNRGDDHAEHLWVLGGGRTECILLV